MSTNVEERREDLSAQNELPAHPPQRAQQPAAPPAHRVPGRPARRPPPPNRPGPPRHSSAKPQDAHQPAEELRDVVTQQPLRQPSVAGTVTGHEASAVLDYEEEKRPIMQPRSKLEKKNPQKKRIKEESKRNCCCFCCQTLCYEVCTLHTQLL